MNQINLSYQSRTDIPSGVSDVQAIEISAYPIEFFRSLLDVAF